MEYKEHRRCTTYLVQFLAPDSSDAKLNASRHVVRVRSQLHGSGKGLHKLHLTHGLSNRVPVDRAADADSEEPDPVPRSTKVNSTRLFCCMCHGMFMCLEDVLP